MSSSLRISIATALAAMPCLGGMASPLLAAESWYLTVTPQVVGTRYKDAPARDQASSAGLYVGAHFGEQGSLTVGGTRSTLSYKDATPKLNQDGRYASAQIHFQSSALVGRVSLRADVHDIGNNDTTGETDNVRVYAAQLAYLATSKRFGADLGYARSRYGDSTIGNGTLRVTQWTPTLGFALNNLYDWLQLRMYRVTTSNELRAQGLRATNAFEAKWIHYFAPNAAYVAETQLGTLVGRRVYGVDGDTGSVYNLADLQRGGVFANAQFGSQLGLRLIVGGGYDRFLTQSTGTNQQYSGAHAFVALRTRW